MCNIGGKYVLIVGVPMGLGFRNVRCEIGRLSSPRVRVVQTLSYAEAVKKGEEDVSRGRDPERSGVSSRSVPVQRDKLASNICFSKIGFVAFNNGYQLYCRDGM